MRVQWNGRVGNKWSCWVVAERKPNLRFIHGVGDTKEAALIDLCEALCDECGLHEHAFELGGKPSE